MEVWEEREKLRSAWGDFLGCQGFDCFFTLTFRTPANSAGLAVDRSKRLLTSFYKSLGGQLAAFVVAEEHKSGSYHCHGMMRLGVQGDEFKLLMLRSLWKAGFDRYGRCRFELIRESKAVQAYVSKYLTKRVCDYALVGKGLRRFEAVSSPGKAESEPSTPLRS